MEQKVWKKKLELRLNDFQNSFVTIFMSFLDTYRKTRKHYGTEHVFPNFYFLFTTIVGFSEYKPMGLFSWELILRVKKNKEMYGLIFG